MRWNCEFFSLSFVFVCNAFFFSFLLLNVCVCGICWIDGMEIEIKWLVCWLFDSGVEWTVGVDRLHESPKRMNHWDDFFLFVCLLACFLSRTSLNLWHSLSFTLFLFVILFDPMENKYVAMYTWFLSMTDYWLGEICLVNINISLSLFHFASTFSLVRLSNVWYICWIYEYLMDIYPWTDSRSMIISRFRLHHPPPPMHNDKPTTWILYGV